MTATGWPRHVPAKVVAVADIPRTKSGKITELAVRDVVQNHLLQVLAILAMEPPVGPESSFLQDEKAKVFAAMRIRFANYDFRSSL